MRRGARNLAPLDELGENYPPLRELELAELFPDRPDVEALVRPSRRSEVAGYLWGLLVGTVLVLAAIGLGTVLFALGLRA